MDERWERAERRAVGWALAVPATAAAVTVVWNPVHVDVGDAAPFCFWAAVLIAAIALLGVLYWSCRARVVRRLVIAAGALLVVLVGAPSLLLLAFVVAVSADWGEEQLASHERVEVVRVRGSSGIDIVYRVELRREIGPFRQTTVVWHGAAEGDRADAARFTGPHEVAVTVPRRGDVTCEYRARFDAVTLGPDRVQDDRDRIPAPC